MRSWYYGIALLAMVLCAPVAQGEIDFIWWGPQDEIYLRVGTGSGVETVVHNVPQAHIGDGTPIVGTPTDIEIEVHARRGGPWGWGRLRYVVTADSSIPMSNGIATIPFTDIHWTSRAGDIPAGSFNGTPDQVILGPTRVFYLVRDWLTFTYSNDRVVPSGVYTGRITYTAAIP